MATAGRCPRRPHRTVGPFRRGPRPKWVRGVGLGPERRMRQEPLHGGRADAESIARVRGVLGGDPVVRNARLLRRARGANADPPLRYGRRWRRTAWSDRANTAADRRIDRAGLTVAGSYFRRPFFFFLLFFSARARRDRGSGARLGAEATTGAALTGWAGRLARAPVVRCREER